MDEAFADRRPVSVMFNNIREALPQFGISQADLLYEAVEEGGITRVIGFFKNPGAVEKFGSVRSTRAYYLDMTLGHDAILMHAGGSEEALKMIKELGMYTINGITDSKTYYRDAERRKAGVSLEHTLFAKGADVEAKIVGSTSRVEYEPGYDPFSMKFEADASISGGNAAESVSVKFSSYKTGIFEYSKADGLYTVSQYGKPMVEGATGEQLKVKNVVVVYTDVSAVGDKLGHMKIRMTGSGDGMLFLGGKSQVIKWSKAAIDKPYLFTDENGEPLTFAAGVSYINVVGINAKVEIG
ncbi:hypothetical protein FACS1894208_07370 [Clostridia bacterium]|nr:hypothetical protein FACS1894208_07370 [Clostridia bacterium]